MSNRGLLVLVLALGVFLAMACGGDSPTATVPPTDAPAPSVTPVPTSQVTPTPSPYPVVVTDSRGIEVVFEQAPQRVVSLSPAHTEIFYALGLGESIVGRDSYSDFPAEATDKPVVGSAFTLDLETLAALEPDLVYTTFEGPVADVERLGIPVLYLFVGADLQDVFDNIALMGRVLDREEEAAALIVGMEARVDAVTDGLAGVEQGPRIFYELDPGLFTVGPGSFIGNVLELLMVENVAKGADSPYPQLSAEVIVDEDPEFIILGDSREYLATGVTIDEVEARAGWSSITAVKDGNVHPFNADLLSRPGPRIVEGIEILAELLYPDLFP